MALNVRKNDKVNGINSTLLVRMTCATMLKGAAKTLTEMATHIHPRAWTLDGCLTANCVTRKIKENIPMFIRANSLMVNFLA